jgi:tetratricopeptide (TPR) repeat protein
MQPDFRERAAFLLSIVSLIVVPVLVLLLLFGSRWRSRRNAHGIEPETGDWQRELQSRTAGEYRRFRIIVIVLFVLGIPLLLLTPKQNAQPQNAVQNQPAAMPPFTVLLLVLPPAVVLVSFGVFALRHLRHYDAGVSRAAKQANAGDLDGAIAELRRQIESKGLSAARANALGCLLTLKEDWHEARRMFDEAESRGMSPALLRANRGVAAWRSGDPEAALPLLARAALDSPVDVNVRCHLCLILADLGRIDEARAQLQSIEELHKKQVTLPADARRSLEKQIEACRDRLAGKPKTDLAALDEL